MNKGLKNYTKQLSKSLDGTGEVYVNINKNDANAHVVIPLLTSVGQSPISTSLIFNYQDRNESGIFGNGVKLNWYGKVSRTGTSQILKNADGSTDVFVFESYRKYVNKERQMSVTLIPLSEYTNEADFLFKEKNGTTLSYESNMLEYPRRITTKSGDQYTSDFIAATPYISNGKGDQITFTKTGSLVTKAEWKKNGVVLLSVVLEYESSCLSRLIYKKGDVILAETTLSYSDTQVILRNEKIGRFIKCDIDSGMVTSLEESCVSNSNPAHIDGGKFTIVHQGDEEVRVSDEYGNTTVVFFDKDGMPVFEKDPAGRVVKTAFDKETKAVLYQSAPIDTRNDENILSIEGFSGSSISKETSACSNASFAEIVGSNTCKYSAPQNNNGVLLCETSFEMSGIATDSITAIIWGKQLTDTVLVDNGVQNGVVAKLIVGDEECQAVFDKKTVDNNFDVLVLGVNAKDNFSNVTLQLLFCGNASIEIGKVQILKKELGAFYTYGPTGNLEEMIQSQGKVIVSYDEDGQPVEAAGADGTEYDYEYDSYGNVTKIWGAYNVGVENEYDETVKSNLKKQTISNGVGTQKIVSRKEYDSVTNAVSKEYDELDHQTTYEYNVLGNVKKITDAMGAVSEYEYQNDAILQKMLLKNGNVTAMSAQYEYDNKNRIKKVVLENGCEYEFVYDDCGNISSIKLNGIAVYAYAYDDNGKLVSQEYSNGDKYIFEYENGLVERVLFKRAGESEAVVKYRYEYDALNRVNKVFAGGSDGILLAEYAYDENDRVINQSSADFEVEKTFDNNGSVATQINTVDDYGIYHSYESLRHSKYCNTNTLLNRFKTSSYVSDFSRNAKLTYCDKLLWPVTHDGEIQQNIILNKQNGLRYVSVDGTHLLSYKPQRFVGGAYECGNVEFWFRQNTEEEAVLFSCKGSGNSYIEAIIHQGHIVVSVIDFYGNPHTLLTSEDSVLAGQWNFFALDFHNRDDGEGYTDECTYRLTLNEKSQMFRKINPRINVDVGGDPMYNIGHGYNTYLVSETFNGDIACLRIFPRECATPAQIIDFYNFSKQLIQGTYVPEGDPIVDRSATNLFALSQSEFSKYEVYPLQKNVLSLKGKKPELFGIKTFGRTDSYKEEMFDLDPQTKRYAYKANGSPLSYKFATRDSGTAIVRAKTKDTTSRKQIFDIKDTTIHYIGLYVGSNGNLFLDYEGTSYDTGLAFSSDQWHTVGFSFEEETRVSQFGEIYSLRAIVPGIIITHYTHIRIMLDDNVYQRSFKHDSQATARTVMIGRTFDRVGTDKKYPFGGLMETLAISAEYIDATEFAAIASKLDCTTRLNCYDEFDMYQGSDVYKSGNNILSDRVTYKSLLKTENGRTFEQLSHTVASESISAGGTALTTRAYTTDNLGRVTGIADSLFGNHSYEYDCRGFLVRDDDTVYEYDANGNVTKIGTTVLEYDNTVKDKLVKVGDKVVTYDATNPLVPTSYDGNTYTFEGRRLTRIQKGGKVIDYTYNDQGLRIKKTVTENGTSSETQFFYDGTKLIAEITSEHRFDFLYDENDRLYGFVLDKTATYFYVRDTLENVLGIVDSTGNLVVQYAYNAWGKNLGITGTLATTIGAYNPIRYKGYHFDSDTGMYYCHTRYYVPDWCRWLCADHIAYIRFDSFNQMNLFVYCSNDPIGNDDKSGCKWKSFWSSVENWFGKTFGGFVDLSKKIVSVVRDHFFFGYEEGLEVGDSIGDASKPISFYVKKASKWWKFWEYQVGIKMNFGEFSFSASFGIGEINISASYSGSSVGIQFGINKIGLEISHSTNNISQYHQYYIRTIPTLAVVLVAAACIKFAAGGILVLV